MCSDNKKYYGSLLGRYNDRHPPVFPNDDNPLINNVLDIQKQFSAQQFSEIYLR